MRLSRLPVYTYLAAGLIALAYAIYYAFRTGSFLSILGGLFVASIFWALAARAARKLEEKKEKAKK